jgi:hypothetical protein
VRSSLAVLLLIVGCKAGDVRSVALLGEQKDVPAEIRKACSLTAHKCSKCHPLERLELAAVSTEQHWRDYVERMRLQPGSGITPDDARVIVSCLVYRSFGAKEVSQ